MGMTYPEEPRDIIEIQKLAEEHVCLKRYLSHHLRNSLGVIVGNVYLINRTMSLELAHEKAVIIEEAVNHIIEDLQKVGL